MSVDDCDPEPASSIRDQLLFDHHGYLVFSLGLLLNLDDPELASRLLILQDLHFSAVGRARSRDFPLCDPVCRLVPRGQALR